jgi:hypothetical protein
MDFGRVLPTSAEGSPAGMRRSSPTSAAGCPQPSPPSPQCSTPCSSRRTRLHEPVGAGGDEPTEAGGDAALELVAQGGVGWMGGRLQEPTSLHPPPSFPLRSRDLPRLRRARRASPPPSAGRGSPTTSSPPAGQRGWCRSCTGTASSPARRPHHRHSSVIHHDVKTGASQVAASPPVKMVSIVEVVLRHFHRCRYRSSTVVVLLLEGLRSLGELAIREYGGHEDLRGSDRRSVIPYVHGRMELYCCVLVLN